MKILIDTVYTGRPSTCSTSYLMWKIVEHLSLWREDVFFYFLFPHDYGDNAEELEWFDAQPFRERVLRVFKRYDVRDRMRELLTFDNEMMALSVTGASEYFDWDVVISSRISQLAMFRLTRRPETGFGHGNFRGVIGLDEMPLLSFRKTIQSGQQAEVHTLANYLLADGVVINNLWTWKLLRGAAAQHLAGVQIRNLQRTVKEAVPVKLTRLQMTPKRYKKGEFVLAFTGRVTGTRNFKGVAELFRTQFAYPLGKKTMRFVVSTNSESVGSAQLGEIDFIEFKYNKRAAFHKFLGEEAHLVVNLSTVEDFSLSTYEPLLFGVPVIVPDVPWSEFLGKDYPFRAKDFVTAYGLISQFQANYAKMYQQFVQWEQTTWKQLCDSERNVTTASLVQQMLEQYETAASQYADDHDLGGVYLDLADAAQERQRIKVSMVDTIEINNGTLFKPLEGTPIGRRPSISTLKLALYKRGYVDELEPGVMRKV